jgi:hypothetical protein
MQPREYAQYGYGNEEAEYTPRDAGRGHASAEAGGSGREANSGHRRREPNHGVKPATRSASDIMALLQRPPADVAHTSAPLSASGVLGSSEGLEGLGAVRHEAAWDDNGDDNMHPTGVRQPCRRSRQMWFSDDDDDDGANSGGGEADGDEADARRQRLF